MATIYIARPSLSKMADDLEKLFNLSPDLMCIGGADGHFERLNPAFEKTLGWSREELLRRPFIDLVHPEDVDATLQQMERLESGARVSRFENRCRCLDESWRVLRWTAYLDGESGLVYCVATDVTEVRERERHFHLALDASPVAMVIVAENGLFTYVNRAAETLFGYEREDLIGESVEILVPTAQRTEHVRHRAAFASDAPSRPMGVRRDLIALRRDGVEIPVEIGLTPIQVDGATLVLSSIVDLTQRKKAEREQLELLAELRHALDEVETLRGLVQICAKCKRVRDDAGSWHEVETYVSRHTLAAFSHSICPECGPELYGDAWEA